MLERALRSLLSPLAAVLAGLRVQAAAVTVAGLALATIGSGVLLVSEQVSLAYALMALGVLCDALDGEVARRGARASVTGSFVDSITDRVVEAEIYVSTGWHWSGAEVDRKFAMLTLVLFVLSYLCSYCALWCSPLDPKSAALGPISRGGRLAALLLTVTLRTVHRDSIAYGTLAAALLVSVVTLLRRIWYTYGAVKAQPVDRVTE